MKSDYRVIDWKVSKLMSRAAYCLEYDDMIHITIEGLKFNMGMYCNAVKKVIYCNCYFIQSQKSDLHPT